MVSRYPKIDLRALAREAGVDLDAAVAQLTSLYADVDRRNGTNTSTLDLPCRQGCDACCHESVFLTPLEFFAVWDYVQRHLGDATRQGIIERGLAIYEQESERILALEGPPPPGETDHFAIARQLRFRCPLLGEDGACQVYPARELYARLFGCSFNAEGGVYGCHLVGAHLAGKTVTLVSAPRVARLLEELPLTGKRQVYPYYIDLLYGGA